MEAVCLPIGTTQSFPRQNFDKFLNVAETKVINININIEA